MPTKQILNKSLIWYITPVALLASTGCRPLFLPGPQGIIQSQWTYGIIEPAIVLQYIYTPEDPPECKKPTQMLTAIADNVKKASERENVQCTATVRSSILNSETLEINCIIPDKQPECKVVYLGHIWSEQRKDSAVNYYLVGVGWLRTICKSGHVYETDESIEEEIISNSGRAIDNIVRRCR